MTGVLAAGIEALTALIPSADPYPQLAALRELSPYSPQDGLVIVGKYTHCSGLLRHPDVSSARDQATLVRSEAPRSRNFLNLDPPDHTRLRRLITRAFTPRVVAELEPRIRAIADDLMDAAARRETFDVVRDLASPLPMLVICELLGVPAADHDMLLSWSAALARSVDLPELRDVERVEARETARTRMEIVKYFQKLVARRRSSPAGDLISYLTQVEDDGDTLSENELIATCVLLVSAGHDTTVNLISNGILALLRNPAALSTVADDPAAAPALVEEALRYDAPVQISARVARTDMQVDGVSIAAGDLLVLLLGAANRDPSVFDRPEEFRPGREHAAKHLSFAAGPHFCLGSSLARLEGAIAFESATRLVEPKLDQAGLTYKPNLTLRGPARMPVSVNGIRERDHA
ncbi:cytochrome P450 [Amycolatopsis pithecellobii]|uniref:Cytochrome P450 n=1 Tax=Amycolatopsis pithecellobii TaxID=664692 RepID=A0A6N7ZCM7_9PSEU|nr:cytochrome P450 [Amycolatopsis pithecellobii]MTD59532.1 cytochrome P450 [Amycolatopsis pithecellobii]